ncbi:hypothetical protein [Schumannella soli]|uniref:Uncharacterized protein n=1 Tax=Schumannella soli TaxID=2590779 RepID=A0A506Y1F9_9MICO|nr:hypothetical protein [Schumannella soli]TPW75460.1 hypothetical protein FJ657_06070 [Schumannella soli]
MSRIARTLRRSTTTVSRSRRRAIALAGMLLGVGLVIGVVSRRRAAAAPIRVDSAIARPVGLGRLRDVSRERALAPVTALGGRAVAVGLRAAGRTSIRGMLASAAALGIAVVVVSTGAAGTFAFVNSQAEARPASTVSAGTFSLSIRDTNDTPISALPVSPMNLLPGDSVSQLIRVKNTGNAAAVVTAKLDVTSAPFEVRINGGVGSSTTCPTINDAVLGTTPTPSATLPAGFTGTVCVLITLPGSATQQSATGNVKLTFDAKQGS